MRDTRCQYRRPPTALRCLPGLVLSVLLLSALFWGACGGNGGGLETPADRQPFSEARPEPSPAAGEPPSPAGSDSRRDGTALAPADPLRPETADALPPGFPVDIPLGDWLTIGSVRLMGDGGFVIECSAAEPRDAVCAFFAENMPLRGWKPVSHSSKSILSVLSFRKGERVLTVMVKRQVAGEPVAFDLSYKEN